MNDAVLESASAIIISDTQIYLHAKTIAELSTKTHRRKLDAENQTTLENNRSFMPLKY